jgi:hypothetical protein
MLNENKLWEPTEKFLAPQEKIMMLKQEVDSIVENFLQLDPKTIKAEELITETTKINSFNKMAESLDSENLPQYLTDAVEKIRNHKNKGNADKMKSMSSFVKVHDPRKPRIGTHN